MSTSRKPAPNGTGPLEDAAKLFEVESSRPETIPAQLRRRRAASYRCEPLADGRRDPVSKKRPANVARTLHIAVGRRTAWLFGDRTFDLLEQVGVDRRQWDYEKRVWMIPSQFADDVMAFAEWRQRRVVTCEAIDR